MTFPIILKKSLFALGISAVVSCGVLACGDGHGGCDMQASETPHTQVVIEAFLSACHTSPDPASLSYYLDQLESGTVTPNQVKTSIATTCAASKTADLCQHVSGLSDLCKTSTN